LCHTASRQSVRRELPAHRSKEDSMSESRFGGDTGFEEEETSASSDARAGFDSDSDWNKPPERVVEETSEDDADSAEADRAAGYDDEDIE
jgi:hypothetical protein